MNNFFIHSQLTIWTIDHMNNPIVHRFFLWSIDHMINWPCMKNLSIDHMINWPYMKKLTIGHFHDHYQGWAGGCPAPHLIRPFSNRKRMVGGWRGEYSNAWFSPVHTGSWNMGFPHWLVSSINRFLWQTSAAHLRVKPAPHTGPGVRAVEPELSNVGATEVHAVSYSHLGSDVYLNVPSYCVVKYIKVPRNH